jgi:hypothetical protein
MHGLSHGIQAFVAADLVNAQGQVVSSKVNTLEKRGAG